MHARRRPHRRHSTIADENIRAVEHIQQREARERTRIQRAGDAVASAASHEGAILAHLVWFAAWIVLNAGWLPLRPFDPFPFSLLTTIVSLEAIFLTLFVLGSQNRMTQEADHRAHLDLQINLLSEQEMTLVLQTLGEICDHLGLQKTVRSAKFQELSRRTNVAQIADHLDRRLNGGESSKSK